MQILTFYASYVKLQKEDWHYIGTVGVLLQYGIEEAQSAVRAIGIDMSTKQNNVNTNNKEMSFRDLEAEHGQSFSDALKSMGCIEITKEQFYTLE